MIRLIPKLSNVPLDYKFFKASNLKILRQRMMLLLKTSIQTHVRW